MDYFPPFPPLPPNASKDNCWLGLPGQIKDTRPCARTPQVSFVRAAYQTYIGPLDPFIRLERTCHSPGCSNPWHHRNGSAVAPAAYLKSRKFRKTIPGQIVEYLLDCPGEQFTFEQIADVFAMSGHALRREELELAIKAYPAIAPQVTMPLVVTPST